MNRSKKVLLMSIALSISFVVTTKFHIQDAKTVVDAQAKYEAAVKIINAYMAAPNPTNGTLKSGYSEYKQAVKDVLQYAQSYIEKGLADIVTALTVLDVLPKNTVEIQKLEKDLNKVIEILKLHVSINGRPPFSKLATQLSVSDQPPAATAEDEFGPKVVPFDY